MRIKRELRAISVFIVRAGYMKSPGTATNGSKMLSSAWNFRAAFYLEFATASKYGLVMSPLDLHRIIFENRISFNRIAL